MQLSVAFWVWDPNEHAYVVVWPTPAVEPALQLTLHELPEASGCVHCEEFTLDPTVNVHGAARAKGGSDGEGCETGKNRCKSLEPQKGGEIVLKSRVRPKSRVFLSKGSMRGSWGHTQQRHAQRERE